jgi:hypothetical protein
MEGKDANNITQSYSDITPGRPTAEEHRAPEDDLRNYYQKKTAEPLTKLHALTIRDSEFQTHDYYMNIGPLFSDPVARQLYAEIASIEEQHVTQYESIIDPSETWLEKWLLHEAMEAYNYYGCMQQESNSRIKAIWERMLDYELGQVQYVMELFKNIEKRDPAEILPPSLPDPFPFKSQRDFVRETLTNELDLRVKGPTFVPLDQESEATLAYRRAINAEGSPSDAVAAGYVWRPATELRRKAANL